MSISDITNRTPSGTNNFEIQNLLKQKKADEINLSKGYKYLSRPDLVESGFSRIYDETQNKLLSANTYKTTSQTALIDLANEQQAIKDIKAIVLKFSTDINNNTSVGTPTSKANEALQSIQNILSKQVGGKYVMGGNTPGINPLVDGADLVNKTNYDPVNKLFFNNFSKSTSDTTKINISADHTIENSFIDASMDEIVNLIGAINLYKHDQAATPEYTAAILKANDALGVLSLSIDTVVETTIPAADLKNTNDIKNANDNISNLFTVSLEAITAAINLAAQSLFATFALIAAEQNLKNKIFGQGF
jgi:hypothetical protein